MVQQPHINPLDLETSALFDLRGKVALITGASGALGGAVAKGPLSFWPRPQVPWLPPIYFLWTVALLVVNDYKAVTLY